MIMANDKIFLFTEQMSKEVKFIINTNKKK